MLGAMASPGDAGDGARVGKTATACRAAACLGSELVDYTGFRGRHVREKQAEPELEPEPEPEQHCTAVMILAARSLLPEEHASQRHGSRRASPR